MTVVAPSTGVALDRFRRSSQAEWLDDAELQPEELARVLRDLARFNGAMLGHRPIIAFLLRAAARATSGRPLTVLDVGCGFGDLLRATRHAFRKRGLPVKLIGLDLSRETIRIAKEATDAADDIDYHAGDVFSFDPPGPVDVVVSSLLTHHMTDETIAAFLRWMERTAGKGWLIYDLQRHVVPYTFIGLMGRLTRLHPMVIHDGRISVARSLTRAEWRRQLDAAGLGRDAVKLRWYLFRFVIERLR